MKDILTKEEYKELQSVKELMEKVGTDTTNRVLDIFNLYETVIEDKEIRIHDLKEEVEEKEGYIEDWGLH